MTRTKQRRRLREKQVKNLRGAATVSAKDLLDLGVMPVTGKLGRRQAKPMQMLASF